MRKWAFGQVVALGAAGYLMMAVGGGGAAFAGKQDFTLANKTGYQIDEVYVSESRSSHWGRDIMGRGSLGDGDTVDVTFDHGSACHFDLKVKYEDGDNAEWSNLNLCDISKVTLYWDRKNQTTRASTE